jgi:beta-glucuronidase
MIRCECEGVPYFTENGLPYPTAFAGQDYPRFYLDGSYNVPEHGLAVEVPGCFNKIGDPLAGFYGTLAMERRFVFHGGGAFERGLQRLCFEGCFHTAEVWLNGVYLGKSSDPYLPFYFDVTNALCYGGENLLRVEIDNRIGPATLPPKQFEGHKPGWRLYAGIIRSVYIDSLPEVYCFKADVRTHGNEITCDLLFAGYGGGVAHLQYGVVIPEPRRWSPETPNLYTLGIRTPFGTQSIRFGLRDIAVQGRRILVDGSPLTVKGVCRHEEGFACGHALPPDLIRREMDIIKGLGGNLARLAHYPHSESAYDICDETGLYVYTEVANYQAGMGIVQGLFGKSAELRKNRPGISGLWRLFRNLGQLSESGYLKAVQSSLAKLIERERNHPSVLFWGVGNECFSFTRRGRAALRSLKALAAELDPSRPAVYAAFTAPGITPRFEKALDIFDVICINEYYGWYYGSAEDARNYWQKIAMRCPDKPLLLTETGSDSYLSDPASLVRQAELLKAHWALCRSDSVDGQASGMMGMCVWTLKDFACPEYGDDLPVPGHNAKGLYTRDYAEKPAAGALRILWKFSKTGNYVI